MTHPSDETFLDEMAQRPTYWVQAECPPRDGPFSEEAVFITKAELSRLVALARRAPALTCGTCRYQVKLDRLCQLITMPTFIEVQRMREARVDPFQPMKAIPRPGDDRFGCSLHAPAPPEARP